MTNKKKNALCCLLIVISVMAAITLSACGKKQPSSDSESGSGAKVSLTMSETEIELEEDEVYKLEAVTDSGENIKWSTSNGEIVSVSAQGRVIAKSVGEAVVSARAGDAVGECKVKVIKSTGGAVIELENPILNLSVAKGAEKINGKANVNGVKTDLSEADAKYTIDDKSIAAVSADGTITPFKAGSALLSVTVGKKTKTFSVEVYTMFVADADDWNAMLALPGDLNARYLVTADIDFTGKEYSSKSYNTGKAFLSQSFTGNLNGGGHSVKNITMPTSLSEQSLFGTIIGLNLENIAFENVRFTSGACGLAVRMMQHYDVVDENGNEVPGATEAAYNTVKNVSLDFVYENNGIRGICGSYYGGGLENVFLNMRMANGGKFNKASDYAVTNIFYVWQNNNYFNNLIVLAEDGEVNPDWTVTDGSKDVSKDTTFVCGNKMEACYKARTVFDSTVWSVVPGELPKLK